MQLTPRVRFTPPAPHPVAAPPPLPPRTVRRRVSEALLIAAAVATVLWFQFWTVSANGGFSDLGDDDYYRLLVRGWRKGQLHLDKAPSPELLALADPYDPRQNGPYRLGDASYYKGRYYLYFGPAPAVTLMLPYALVTGREMTTGAAVFVFTSVGFLAAAGLWLAIRRRYFPASAPWTAALGLLALGFGTHLLALAQRPRFWELPIAAGLAFLMLALSAGYHAVHGRRRRFAMAIAGLCVGLATASRPTCLFAAPLLFAPLWVAWRRTATSARHLAWGRLAIAAALPLGACGLALMAHNYARFENPLEFGQSYQLSGAYEGQLQHFSLRFLLHNVAVYFFQLPGWTWEFPFVFARTVPAGIPGYFGTEEVTGLAVTFPFVWFALALPLAWWRRPAAESHALSGIAAGIAGYAVPVAGLLLCYFSTTMRYQADYGTALGLLALVGLLAAERWAQHSAAAPDRDTQRKWAWLDPRRVLHRRSGVAAAAVALCLGTVGMAVLVSFDYHGRSLRREDPKRWQRFERAAHATLAELGRMLGQWDGPRVFKVRLQPRPAGTVETFWSAADPRAGERILIRHEGDHLLRFGYARGETPARWGELLRWEPNHTHTVSVQVPSLYGPRGEWMRRLRRAYEFRERSSVSVWFSGGLALGLVVEPLPAGLHSGGAVGGDFSGQVRTSFERVYRDDEIGPPAWSLAPTPRGGTLRLRVRFPDHLAPEGEPLYAAGALYGSDIIYVRPVENGVAFVFEKWAAPPVSSPPIALGPGEQVIELEVPSFTPGRFGSAARGDIVVRVNGTEVLRTLQSCHPFPPGSESIARNPFDTTCASEFRGWVLDAEWVPADQSQAGSESRAHPGRDKQE